MNLSTGIKIKIGGEPVAHSRCCLPQLCAIDLCRFLFYRSDVLGQRYSSLCDVLTPQTIRDKVPNIFRCLRWSTHFCQFFQNVRLSRARAGALGWLRVGVRIRVGIGEGSTPSRDLTNKKAQKHEKQLKNLLKVKYIWYFIWYDLWDKASRGASKGISSSCNVVLLCAHTSQTRARRRPAAGGMTYYCNS